MKLNYNIIWIEDKFTEEREGRAFKAIKNDIESFLKDEFFNIDSIEIAGDFEQFKEIFDTQKEYDLIITDLSLNNGTTGKQVIDFVRNTKHNLTEILFYSANKGLKETELINNSRISYFNLTGDYKDLQTEIKSLISLTIRKFQHIVTMRGMIMQETSSLDVVMNRLVKNYIKDSKNKDNAAKILPPILLEIQKNAKEKCDKAFSNKPNIILKDNVLFSASQKIFALGKILEILDQKDFSEDYNKEIIWFRNQFAHAEIFVNEEGKEYFKIKIEGIDQELFFDEKLCRKIRKSIIKHKENLDNLELIMK
jgi:hypothetical protein